MVSGLLKVGHFASVAAMLTAFGLALALGWKARLAAATLALFVVPATLLFHAFWLADPAANSNQLNHSLKNAALSGALLMFPCTAVAPCLSQLPTEQVENQ